jgi:hypothetical protein
MTGKNGSGVQANGAQSQSFAAQTHNGKPEGIPKNESAPCYRGQSNTLAACTSGNNGSSESETQEQWNIRRGPIIKLTRYGDLRFVQVLQDTVRDHRLSLGARGLLVYLLSQPKNWQPLLWRIKQETGLSDYVLRGYMQELRKYGYARLLNTKDGHRWEVCEFPNQVWLKDAKATYQNLQRGKFGREKNDRISKNDSSGFSHSSKNNGVSDATTHSFLDVPELPFPESEDEMYQTLDDYSDLLESYDVFADIDRDGDFFNDFSSRRWRYPSGRPVRNWIVAYIQRRQHVEEQTRQAWTARRGRQP